MTPLDSVWIEEEDDTLATLFALYSDPDTIGNYLRYFTKRNSESFYPGFASVFDDNLINGQTFHFPLDRGQSRSDDLDLDTYGYFWKGDTVIVRWCAIDRRHYDFWKTIEFDSGIDGPFSSATIIESNIEGGLGVWGGYGCSYDTIIVSY